MDSRFRDILEKYSRAVIILDDTEVTYKTHKPLYEILAMAAKLGSIVIAVQDSIYMFEITEELLQAVALLYYKNHYCTVKEKRVTPAFLTFLRQKLLARV
ncbi:hypothetical protein B0S90_2842 [Caldicellulosiruptor bescii]|uniref:Uncharacterized protein n=2 Tax=Caldicellulosiruptor bescii TaxID=31899 RepID=B9MP07_CALBD|nr:hypothetical protein [Caldicellulosiruptor bescii]ACM61566.1 hypothetical protein Athe_2498 [Caldicellulosiruptor bescii DSM 6725]PBC88621.1 hypothetical protein B0S87_1649 [Caldicellulosiruptor bescii]PBC91898.1 hypothetical protein B0S89_2344 [Caldicellulosiruptor bescii]PBD02691.1 hypothetical protein B0S85_0230 [Caldicellulosiruptor bescii]PBD07692.1 hypothetical protein B0S90_2842 [Caldicellulosiruptor bescii]